MTNYDVKWRMTTRHVEPRDDTVSAIGLAVTYRDRECDISIALPQPLIGKTPENEVALAEFRRLRDALNDILDEQ